MKLWVLGSVSAECWSLRRSRQVHPASIQERIEVVGGAGALRNPAPSQVICLGKSAAPPVKTTPKWSASWFVCGSSSDAMTFFCQPCSYLDSHHAMHVPVFGRTLRPLRTVNFLFPLNSIMKLSCHRTLLTSPSRSPHWSVSVFKRILLIWQHLYFDPFLSVSASGMLRGRRITTGKKKPVTVTSLVFKSEEDGAAMYITTFLSDPGLFSSAV